MKYPPATYLTTLAVVIIGAVLALVIGSALIGAEPRQPDALFATAGLQRDTRFDSEQAGPVITIVCEGYSNRPGYDYTTPAAQGKASVGFRVVSDCDTILTPTQGKEKS